MMLTSKQWILVSIGSVLLLLALAVFGGSYRALGTLLLPVGLWLSLRRDPEQAEIRPAIRLLGWLFIAAAGFAVAISVVAIAGDR